MTSYENCTESTQFLHLNCANNWRNIPDGMDHNCYAIFQQIDHDSLKSVRSGFFLALLHFGYLNTLRQTVQSLRPISLCSADSATPTTQNV
ncbi:MAG TPA: hypothetical protein VHH12_11115, partial [Mycobacterium sp.]|nr:hypothetical protein [Mycobacterium sp.]